MIPRQSRAHLLSFWRRMRRCASRAFGVGGAWKVQWSIEMIVVVCHVTLTRRSWAWREAGVIVRSLLGFAESVLLDVLY